MNNPALVCLWFMILMAVFVVVSGMKTFAPHERGVIFRLGRMMGARGPGRFFVIPLLEKIVRIDLRPRRYNLPALELITRDRQPVRITGTIVWQVFDPNLAVLKAVDYTRATMQTAELTLRDVAQQLDLDVLLGQREKIAELLIAPIEEEALRWGVRVTEIEIQAIERA